MKRTPLKVKDVNKEIEYLGLSYNKKDFVERVEDEKFTLFFVNRKTQFFLHEKKILPTLHLLQEKPEILKKAVVDMGAVKFVVNGADIMRPGITQFDEAEKGEFIVIIDENNKKPLSVGKALFSGEEIMKMDSGKVVKNIHFVGDEIWKND